MDERFGISPSVFDEYLLYEKKNTYWFVRKSPLISGLGHLKIKRLGIKTFQKVGSFMKPTTRMIQYFGRHAAKAVFNIDLNMLRGIVSGEYIPVDTDMENGYIILLFKGQILGLGLLINGTVRSQLPSQDVKFLTASV